jgi:hypothetical protein
MYGGIGLTVLGGACGHPALATLPGIGTNKDCWHVPVWFVTFKSGHLG